MRRMKTIRLRALCVTLGAASLFALAASAQDFPSKPIQIVVGSTPGSSGDAIARLIAKQLPAYLGQPVVVENRAGASGAIAAERVSKASPDGYTLLMLTNTTIIAKAMRPTMPVDLERDFVSISLVANVPLVWVTNPALPAKDMKALVALAKAKPGKLSYASAGVASAVHVAAELFKMTAGVDILHVPFKGASEAAIGATSGETDLAITGIVSVAPLIAAGKLTPLAVTTSRRSSLLPNVPTLEESGIHGADFSSWVGLLAPANVPKGVVQRLNAAIAKAVGAPEVQEALRIQGMEPATGTPEQFATFMKDEIAQTAKTVKFAGVKDE